MPNETPGKIHLKNQIHLHWHFAPPHTHLKELAESYYEPIPFKGPKNLVVGSYGGTSE